MKWSAVFAALLSLPSAYQAAKAETVSWNYRSSVDTSPVGGLSLDPVLISFSYSTSAPVRYSDANQAIYGDVVGSLQVGSNIVQFTNGILTIVDPADVFAIEICRSCAFVPGLKANITGDVYGRLLEHFDFELHAQGGLLNGKSPPTSLDLTSVIFVNQDLTLRSLSGLCCNVGAYRSLTRTSDYTLDLVAPVPLQPSAISQLTGLILLGLLGWWRKRRSANPCHSPHVGTSEWAMRCRAHRVGSRRERHTTAHLRPIETRHPHDRKSSPRSASVSAMGSKRYRGSD